MSEHADYCHIETECTEPGHCTCLPSWRKRADLIAEAKRYLKQVGMPSTAYPENLICRLVAELEGKK